MIALRRYRAVETASGRKCERGKGGGKKSSPSLPLSLSPFHLAKALILATTFALIPLLAPTTHAQVSEAARFFDTGNQHYAEGAYQDALAAYEQALANGYTSGALYYNMGNAYYRLDERGQAIRYYEKARRLIPDDPQLLHNLEIVRSQINAPFSTLPTPFWVTWWKRYVVRTGAMAFFIGGLLFYVLAAALLGHRIWTRTRNAWHRRALSASLILGLLLLITAFGASLDRLLDRQAVVIADQTALRQAPQDDATSDLDIHEGVLLDVLDQQGGWLEVRLPNGVSGWILADAVGEI